MGTPLKVAGAFLFEQKRDLHCHAEDSILQSFQLLREAEVNIQFGQTKHKMNKICTSSSEAILLVGSERTLSTYIYE